MTVAGRVKVHDGPRCGGKLHGRVGACSQWAGWGTDHPGTGRCKLHGGATPRRSGRYSSIKSKALRELYEKHESDPDPLNILPELAHCRAIFQDFVDRYADWRDALLAWHESYRSNGTANAVYRFRQAAKTRDIAAMQAALAELDGTEPTNKPTQVLDQADAYKILSEITKIVERIERIRATNAVSRPELLRVMSEMGRVVERHVENEVAREMIRDGWLQIRIA